MIVIEQKYGPYVYGYGAAEDTSVAVTEVARVASPTIVSNPKIDVTVYVYDISDKEEPKLEKKFAVDGNYYAARMIGEHVYVLATHYIEKGNPVIPEFKEGNEIVKVDASEIYYPYVFDSNFMFTSLMAIDLEDMDFEGDIFMIGASGTIYVSENAIYLTHYKNNYNYNWENMQEDLFKEVVKVFPINVRVQIEKVLDSEEIEFYQKQRSIEEIFQSYFNDLSDSDKQELQEKMQNAVEDFYSDWSKKNERTVVHKIGIDGLEIDYEGSGEVPGYVLNQFSLDEYKGNLRIATTTGNMGFGFGGIRGATLNHLYVLDKDLEIIGSVEDLASGERIYSARFMGDKAYMVTFRQVDPLFVIDLSNAKNPKVLGYLKVTGFSSYLQLLDENHLIGIGRDATEQGGQQGVKVSLFDVSDFENPKEVDKYVISQDEGWSSSEAEQDHKAVLLDKEKGILVIPVSYYKSTYSADGQYEYDNWMGAYVFDVDENRLDLKGKISHNEKKQNQPYYWNQYVRRSLYMDDVLYTISDAKIKANLLGDLRSIGEIELPWEQQVYQPAYDVGAVI